MNVSFRRERRWGLDWKEGSQSSYCVFYPVRVCTRGGDQFVDIRLVTEHVTYILASPQSYLWIAGDLVPAAFWWLRTPVVRSRGGGRVGVRWGPGCCREVAETSGISVRIRVSLRVSQQLRVTGVP